MKKLLLIFIFSIAFSNVQAQTPCSGGNAGIYPCDGITLQSYISSSTMGAFEAQDSWGWTDSSTGKEYAIVALDNGTAFVDISNPINPTYLGRLNTQTGSSLWRDVKVYNNHAYIVSDANGNHGMQIFNLTKLRNVTNPPQNFSRDGMVTWGTSSSNRGRAHNIIINEDTGYAYVSGVSPYINGGLIIFDLNSSLTNPTKVAEFGSEGYCHDAQVVVYNGPDPDYQGKEIMIGSFSDSDFVKILDVTNKNSIQEISNIAYSDKEYTHQGWFTDDKRFFIVGDEVDETESGFNTRTLVFDLSDLDNPTLHYTHYGNTPAIDHNGYVRGNRFYLANYAAGMRVFKIDGLYNETSPSMTEVNYFDTFPTSNQAGFNGTWNVYPFFESGNLIATGFGNESINGDGGLFVLKDPNYDNTPPTVICQNITVNLDHLENPITISVNDIDNGTFDDFGITSLSIDKTTFTIDDLGPNTVTLTAEDDYGNISTCTATVTVEEYIPVNFTYDAGSWTPNPPFSGTNPSNFKDVIEVVSGTANLSSNVIANNVNVSNGAKLSVLNATLHLAGNIDNQGTIEIPSGTLEFIGEETQNIGGNPFTISNMMLSASGTIQVNTEVGIEGILSVNDGQLNTNNQLVFKSSYDDVTETHTTGMVGPVSGTINGNVVVERFIPAKRAYRLVSSPVTTATTIRENWQENGSNDPGYGTHITGSGGATNGFDPTQTNNPSIFTVNTATQQFESVSYTNNDATLSAGESFLLFVRGDRTIDLNSNTPPPTDTRLRTTGVLHTGAFNIADISNIADGSTLVGNPYQAPINMQTVLASASNINQRYYHVYDPTINTRGAYVTVDVIDNTNTLLGGGSSGSDADRFLQPGQAAFVNTIANGSGSLTINEAHKDFSGIGTNVFDPLVLNGTTSRINISLFQGEAITSEDKPIDGLQIFFEEGANPNYDQDDAFKSFNFDENLAVSLTDKIVSINRTEQPQLGDEVELFINNYRSDTYTFETNTENLPAELVVYLVDNYHSQQIQLNHGKTEISFTIDNSIPASIAEDRFHLYFERVLNVNEIDLETTVNVYPNPVNTILNIHSTHSYIKNVEVFDLRGRRMSKLAEPKVTEIQLKLSSLETAVYFVRVTTESGTVTKKIIKE